MREYGNSTIKKRRSKKLAQATPTRDAWLCGYAAALAAVRRLYHEDQVVCEVMRCDGLTPTMLAHAGAERFDMSAIRLAFKARSGAGVKKP